jgi:hypothetical protein
MLEKSHPERAAELGVLAQADVKERWALYEQYAHDGGNGQPAPATEAKKEE